MIKSNRLIYLFCCQVSFCILNGFLLSARSQTIDSNSILNLNQFWNSSFKKDSLVNRYLKIRDDPSNEKNVMVFHIALPKSDSNFTGIDTVDVVQYDFYSDSINSEKHLIAIREYNHGKKLKVTGYFEEGNKYCEINFNGYELNGLTTKWYIDGSIREKSYWRDGALTTSIEWYSDGNLKTIKDVNNDRLHVTYWSKKGFKVREELNINKYEGVLITCYYQNGQISYRTIQGFGKQEATEYYSNGKLKSKGMINDNPNLLIGHWIEYYENGKKKIEGNYLEPNLFKEGNIKDGEWKFWNSSGKLIKIEKYKNGKLIS